MQGLDYKFVDRDIGYETRRFFTKIGHLLIAKLNSSVEIAKSENETQFQTRKMYKSIFDSTFGLVWEGISYIL